MSRVRVQGLQKDIVHGDHRPSLQSRPFRMETWKQVVLDRCGHPKHQETVVLFLAPTDKVDFSLPFQFADHFRSLLT